MAVADDLSVAQSTVAAGIGLLSDQPVTSVEADRLTFAPAARTLVSFITHPETATPITLGIYGKWGMGKTSLMRMMESLLKERQVQTLWFNPWEHFRDTVGAQQLLRALRRLAPTWMDESTLAEPQHGLTYFLAGQLAQRASESEATLRLRETALDPSGDYSVYREVFTHLIADAVGENGRLVVFVDDLDRCLPEAVIEVLEDMKLVLSVPRCVFVIGADRELIQRGVRVVYQNLHDDPDVITEVERDYLEKIIQLQFNLPPVDHSRMRSFVMQLTEMEEMVQHADIICESLEGNPRRAKQFINELRLLQTLAREAQAAGKGAPADDELLAKWLVVQRRWPAVYEAVLRHPTLLAHLERIALEPDPDQRARLSRASPLAARFAEDYRLLDFLGKGARFGEQDVRAFIYLSRSSAESAPEELVLDDESLLADLFSDDAVVRETALGTLERGPAPVKRRAREAALQHLETESDDEVIAALEILRRTPEASLAAPIVGLLENQDLSVSVRVRALAALAEVDTDAAREKLAELGLVFVPAGEFTYGAGGDAVRVDLPAFFIDRTPVTNAAYREFVDSTGHRRPPSWRRRPPEGVEWEHPVTGITFDDAQAFAHWRGGSLPTDEQWERAARGEDGRRWPAGEPWQPGWGNVLESDIGQPTPVTAHSAGASPYGCVDMIGNVWEYVLTRRTQRDDGPTAIQLRGGSHLQSANLVDCSAVAWYEPAPDLGPVGFRCCLTPRYASEGRSVDE